MVSKDVADASLSDSPSPCALPKQAGRFPIVGIGASAGGFEALRRLLEAMPADPNVALVVIQHLSRDKESLASELLAKCTPLPVTQVAGQPLVRPNHVYIIPPGKYLRIAEGRLHLSEMEGARGVPVAIDHFFRSLAKDQRQCAVAVVLSGTGSDGSLGVKAVKEAGGLVIAQDTQTAEHRGMPQSAIDTGAVDQILSPEEIPAALVRFARHPYICEATAATNDEPSENDEPHVSSEGLGAVIALLQSRGNLDFHRYKPNTLLRRTRRRMCLQHIEQFAEYVEYLGRHPAEVEALAKDLLISVTDFFRDPDAWLELATTVIRPLLQSKASDDGVRAWVAGCATGEESYTVAMLILEELQTQHKTCRVQVFASDIDKNAIQLARAGRYPRSVESDISPDRLKRFFTLEENGSYFQVTKELREAVIFADQNLTSDPPFSHLDLICCRNVLIYLKSEIQQKIIKLFHFSLQPSGYLMLGTAETIGRQDELFGVVSKRWRIYRRMGQVRPERVDLPILSRMPRRAIETSPSAPRRDMRLTHLAQQRLLDIAAPRAVLVDANGRILYINGDVDCYLTHKPGVPSDDLLHKVRAGLRSKLRGAIRKAFAEKRNISVTARTDRGENGRDVRITVRLIHDPERQEMFALLLFEDVDNAATQQAAPKQATPEQNAVTPPAKLQDSNQGDIQIDENTIISQLEEELNAAKDNLQLTLEQFETSNEEYKASNEEVMSINEELQSTNEELETSKEELQSLNEELSTVNHQLACKVEELETKHADLENLISATDIATICLDTKLAIRWFTAAAQQLIRVKPSDHGRPVNDLAHDFTDGDLVHDCQQVLKRLIPVETEVCCNHGRVFIRRVVPYRADDHRIGGVVITLVDITARRNREEELRVSEARFRRALSVEGIGILFFDPAGKLLDCNQWFLETTGYSRSDVEAGLLTSLSMTPPEWTAVTLEQQEKLTINGRIGPYEKEYFCKDGSRLWMMLSGSSLEDGTVVTHCINITDRKHTEMKLCELNRTLETQVAQRTELMSILQHVTRVANEARTIDEAMRAALASIAQYNGWKVGHVWQLECEGSQQMISHGIWHLPANVTHTIAGFEAFRNLTEQARFSSGQGLIGAVMESAQPTWIDDVADSSDWQRRVPGLGLHAAVAFPITIEREVVAVMEFLSDRASRPHDRFVEIMPDIGIQLGHLIRRKRLERLVSKTANEEQRRIGRELHDGISQQLTGGALIAESLRQKLLSESSEHANDAGHLVQILQETHEDVRQLSNGLLPSSVDSADLRPGLRGLVLEATERFNVPCELNDQCFDERFVTNDTTAFIIFQICREAVHNALKHASPNHILVELVTEDEFRMTVKDDGQGFDVERLGQQSNGIRIMTYRAESTGGALEIKSTKWLGTTVTLTIPQSGCQR